jgi:hypothetical protein
LEAPAIRVKQSICRPTWQIHHQGLMFRSVMCWARHVPSAETSRSDSNRRFDRSPIDALIDLKVGCGLCGQIPVRFDCNSSSICASPQSSHSGGSARWGYVRGLRVHPNVIQNPPDLPALGDKGDQAHLPAT